MVKNKISLILLGLIVVSLIIFTYLVYSLIQTQKLRVYTDVPNLRLTIGNQLLFEKLLLELGMKVVNNSDTVGLLRNFVDKDKTLVEIKVTESVQPLFKVYSPEEKGKRALYSSGNITYEKNTLLLTLYVNPETFKQDKKQYLVSINSLLLRLLVTHAAKSGSFRVTGELESELLSLAQKYLPQKLEDFNKSNTLIYENL